MAEMEQLRKVDEDALKAFITRKTDRVRLAYGRSTGEYPRQSIFIATKNPGPDGTYLKDPTGNRRWWPVRCEPRMNALGQIDFKGLTAARNQLFAEALHVVRTAPGEKLSMDTPLLKEQAKAVVGQRHAPHQWTESISSWIERCDSKAETRRDFLTSRDVYVEALQGSDVRLTHRDMTAIAGVLRSLGWEQASRRVGKNVSWGWKRVAIDSGEKISLDEMIAAL
jgi:predicted P-loop ATPase